MSARTNRKESMMAMSRAELEAVVARVQPGDVVTAQWQSGSELALPTTGEVWRDALGWLRLGPSALCFETKRYPETLVSLVIEGPAKRRIKRGDVIASAEDMDRWDIPSHTIFRDAHAAVRVQWPVSPERAEWEWGRDWFPLRCVSVLADDEAEWGDKS